MNMLSFRFTTMSRLLAVYVLCGSMVIAGEPAPVGALQNGDVNCDGRIDINDAVYVLLWLFLSGQAPCLLADPPHLVEQITTLDDELSQADAALDECEADFDQSQAALVETQGDLITVQAALADSQASLTSCESTLAATSTGQHDQHLTVETPLSAAGERWSNHFDYLQP